MTTKAHKRATAPASRQRGLTLIEIMVALVVGLILTAGAIQIFASARQGFRANDAMARIQEDGRYALEFLARDIRTAAFWGCAQEVEMNSRLNSGGGVDFTGPEITGTDATGPNNSDTLTIRHATQAKRLAVQQTMPTTSAAIVVTSVDEVEVGDILLVTDCEAADVFQVTNTQSSSSSIVHNSGSTPPSPGNYTQSLSRTYGTSATVYTAEEATYALGSDADGDPVLQRTVNGTTQDLVTGVQDMQVRFGIDEDNDEVPNSYLRPDQVPDNDGDGTPDWEEIMAVRLQLLVRSKSDNIADTPQQYTIAGTTATAPDRRMYQVFTTTTGIRNRLP